MVIFTDEEIQKRQFRAISVDYHKLHDRTLTAIYRINRQRYAGNLRGTKILDIGNGGQGPRKILGDRTADEVSLFVGLDNSLDMLERSVENYPRVVGDGLFLPFKDKSFDHCIMNAVIHHLGYTSKRSNLDRVEKLFSEVRRVCRNEAYIYEIVLPRVLELMEQAAARVLRHMPTFVWFEDSIERALGRIGAKKAGRIKKNLMQLTGPFYWYIVIMDYRWLKLPALLSPFRHIFFTIPCGNRQRDNRGRT